eukprot:14488402-Ditylum_brightwellii.AAC.1
MKLTSSITFRARSKPSTMCARFFTLRSWNAERRRIVSIRKSRKQSNAERRVNLRGTVPDPMSAKKLPENVV